VNAAALWLDQHAVDVAHAVAGMRGGTASASAADARLPAVPGGPLPVPFFDDCAGSVTALFARLTAAVAPTERTPDLGAALQRLLGGLSDMWTLLFDAHYHEIAQLRADIERHASEAEEALAMVAQLTSAATRGSPPSAVAGAVPSTPEPSNDPFSPLVRATKNVWAVATRAGAAWMTGAAEPAHGADAAGTAESSWLSGMPPPPGDSSEGGSTTASLGGAPPYPAYSRRRRATESGPIAAGAAAPDAATMSVLRDCIAAVVSAAASAGLPPLLSVAEAGAADQATVSGQAQLLARISTAAVREAAARLTEKGVLVEALQRERLTYETLLGAMRKRMTGSSGSSVNTSGAGGGLLDVSIASVLSERSDAHAAIRGLVGGGSPHVASPGTLGPAGGRAFVTVPLHSPAPPPAAPLASHMFGSPDGGGGVI
jgi:hypothetical protein